MGVKLGQEFPLLGDLGPFERGAVRGGWIDIFPYVLAVGFAAEGLIPLDPVILVVQGHNGLGGRIRGGPGHLDEGVWFG